MKFFVFLLAQKHQRNGHKNLTNTLRPVQCIPTLRTIKFSAYKSEILDYASLAFDEKNKESIFL